MKLAFILLLATCSCFATEYVLPGGTGAGPEATRPGDGVLYSPEGISNGFWNASWTPGIEIGSAFNYNTDVYGRYSVGSVGFRPNPVPSEGYYCIRLKWNDNTGTSAGKAYWRDSTCMGWQKIQPAVNGWTTLSTSHYINSPDYSIEFRELNTDNWGYIEIDRIDLSPTVASSTPAVTLYYNPVFGLAPTACDAILGGVRCIYEGEMLIFGASGTGVDPHFDGIGTSTIMLNGPIPDGVYNVKATLVRNAGFNSFTVRDSKGSSTVIDSSAWVNLALNEVTLFENVRINNNTAYTLEFEDTYIANYAFGAIDQIILEQVPEVTPVQKKLIGWCSTVQTAGMPGNDGMGYIKDHIGGMQQLAFDGLIYGITPGGILFQNDFFNGVVVNEADVNETIWQINTVNWGRFKYNFIRVNTVNGGIATPTDWYSDRAWNSILDKARLLGRICHEANGVEGIMFDNDNYSCPAWTYSQQVKRNTYSFSEYCTKVRQRGREFMAALHQTCPEVTMIIPFGDSLLVGSNLETHSYGLIPAFIDGMLEACGPNDKLIDACEDTYVYFGKTYFENWKQRVRNAGAQVSTRPDLYSKYISAGFATWLSGYEWVVNSTNNYFTPWEFEQACKNGLDVSDEYQWVFTGEARFWPECRNVHQDYDYALARSRVSQTLAAYDWNALTLSNPAGGSQTWAVDSSSGLGQTGISKGILSVAGGLVNGTGTVRFTFGAIPDGQHKIWARIFRNDGLNGFYWRSSVNPDWIYADMQAYSNVDAVDFVFLPSYLFSNCSAGTFWIDLKDDDSGTNHALSVEQFYVEAVKEYQADFNDSGIIDFKDYAMLMNHWVISGKIPEDLTGDKIVDLDDLAIFCGDWLKRESWHSGQH